MTVKDIRTDCLPKSLAIAAMTKEFGAFRNPFTPLFQVGNNTPIFFIRDPIMFPNFIHTQKRNPQTHLKDANMMWDFWGLRPESTHQVMFLMSDRGTPD
ncbi:hypothetical protein ANCDUO_09356, partial [Ancylostoma duodenale]